MKDQDSVRRTVSTAYAKAVAAPGGGSCCGGAPVQKGTVVKLAGYSQEELAALPPEAVVNSFGCGNPLAFSEVGAGETVLDLGSGAGIDILIAGRRVGPGGRAIGIDMTDEMIAKANKNIAASGLTNVEVRKGIIEELPVESGSVDWVVSNCVVNLSPDKPRVFAEIARVLRPGGRMLVSDIVVRRLPDALRDNEALYCSCIAGAISEEAYLDGLRAVGLTDVEVRDRLVYDAAQLRGFIESELPDGSDGGACCGGAGADMKTKVDVRALADQAQGDVWSALIFARKPE